jgi:RNase P/RNase MRP subunit p29
MKELIFIAIITVIILLLAVSTAMAEDFIILNNGDIIVGDIISETDTQIVVRTSFGDVTIDKEDIVEIKTESQFDKGEIVEVLLYDGSRIRGTVIEDEESYLKLQTEVGLVDIPKKNISNVVTGGMTDSGTTPTDNGTSGLDEEYFDKLLEYRKKAIFVDIFTYRSNKKEEWLIRQGSYILSELDFLKKVGKTDLAQQIEQDMSRRNTFLWITGLSTGIFAAATIIGFVGWGVDSTFDDQDITLVALGGSMTALSLVGVFLSLPKSRYLTYTEAKGYAETYNLLLRQELGLTIQDVGLVGDSKKKSEDSEDNENLIAYGDIKNSDVVFSAGVLPTIKSLNLYFYIGF